MTASPNRPEAPRVALYARVSTTEQELDNQLIPLRTLAATRGWTVAGEYVDKMSGAVDSRPQLDQLLAAVRAGEVDTVAVWRFDRFARSTKHLVDTLEEFKALGVEFVSHQEQVDTRTPMGKAMFTVIAAMAELERELIRERVKAGVVRAKAKGVKFGRPEVHVSQDALRALRAQGLSVRKCARELGVSKSIIHNRMQQWGIS